MNSLKLLFAGANQLVKANEVLTVRNLESLSISFNKITELPDLTSLTKLNFINFSYNFLTEKEDELRTKLPKIYITSYENWFKEGIKYQNIDYSIDFTEPANAKMITSNTTRITGRIHMPAEKIQIMIEENLSDEDDPHETYFYADVDEEGNFAFENLNFKKYAGRKCDIHICIGCEFDSSYNRYTGPSLHTYQLK